MREPRSSVYDDLADLYLRLNGYFTVKNFIQHPQLARSDIDVLAVRLEHEKELVGGSLDCPLKNDPKIVDPSDRHPIDVVLAEVKGDRQWFNRSWLENSDVLPYALRRVGFTPSNEEIGRVAQRLRERGRAESDHRRFGFRLVLFSDYPGPPNDFGVHLRWQPVLKFVGTRLELTVGARGRLPVKAWEATLKDPLFAHLRQAYLAGQFGKDLIRRLWPVTPAYEKRDGRGKRPCPP
jgi:hypothetical protein